jgi:hypothetical protein
MQMPHEARDDGFQPLVACVRVARQNRFRDRVFVEIAHDRGVSILSVMRLSACLETGAGKRIALRAPRRFAA